MRQINIADLIESVPDFAVSNNQMQSYRPFQLSSFSPIESIETEEIINEQVG